MGKLFAVGYAVSQLDRTGKATLGYGELGDSLEYIPIIKGTLDYLQVTFEVQDEPNHGTVTFSSL